MTVEEQDEIADLRARLAGLRLLLYSRVLQAKTCGAPRGSPAEDLVQPVMVEIAEVKVRLRALGV